jgi:predicted glutamine amidotransferase
MEMFSPRYFLSRPAARDTVPEASLRETVAAHVRACTRGVVATTAHERTRHFYRRSGWAWSQALV